MRHELNICALLRDFVPEQTDNTSVNYAVYKGDYYVSNETNFMHKVDPETLETKEKVNSGWDFGFSTWHGGIVSQCSQKGVGGDIPKDTLDFL